MTGDEVLLALVDDHLAGRLDERGRADLERLLGENPQARRLYWVAVNHAILLRSAFVDTAAERVLVPRANPRGWRHAALAAAAMLLIALTAGLGGWFGRPTEPVAFIANIAAVGTPGVVQHADGRQTPIREGLALGADDHLTTTAGTSIDLRWSDEATVITVAGDSTITVASTHPPTITASTVAERLRLDRGMLVAEVAHQQPGHVFAIATPDTHITVVGTRFAVKAGDDRTEVDVEQGRVRVATLAGEKPVEIGPGERALRIAGQAPVVVPRQTWAWTDRRPIGVMMLSSAVGTTGNPRGWFNDQTIDTTTAAGRADFERRIDAQIELTISLLREQDAQGVVFWDLEGREHLIGYVGDPRQLARFAPEMDAIADRVMQRLRDAGFAVGVALRAQAAVWEDAGRTPNLRTVNDPAGLLLDKIAYARKRWNATLFPLLGQSGSTIGMETIARRVVAAQPGILLMPTVGDADTYRWCGAWQDPQSPSTPEPSAARRSVPGAFGIYKALDVAQIAPRHDELVRAVAAGDILTFRAWWRDPANAMVARIRAEAKATVP
jgi:ferric-dicitrate binding protein FerR (iron transport regulator)